MEKEQFYNEIDKIIFGLVRKNPDFYFLMKVRTGIHPIDIKLSLERLRKRKRISSTIYRKVMRSAKDKGKVVAENDNLLPVPHLLDYDWRFSAQGNEKMFSLINRYCKKDDTTIVFVGTPSLFKMYFSKGDLKNRYILIDKNADKHIRYITRYSQNFSYIKYDIIDGKPLNMQADLVVMDPPWYLNYYKMFFRFAASILSVDGRIICVLPPKYTRSNTDEELKVLKHYIYDFGIIPEHYFKNAVSYNTPPFERNVLKANGIYCLPKGWRTGDVLIAKRKYNKLIFATDLRYEKSKWEEISIGEVRYKLKTNQNLEIKSFDLVVEKVYDNNIYPYVKRSVSKSEKKINVWTSGNRVFYCNNIPLLYYVLLEYSIHHKHYDLNISEKIEWYFDIKLTDKQKTNIAKCIKLIEDTNRKEHEEYGKWGDFL